jgi:murein DD-endopeptidase MepM/ murein hydrolase activator NlpD
VTLHEGRPFVSSASGAVELWHPSCFIVRHERAATGETVTLDEPTSRRSHLQPRIAFVGAGVALVALATVGWAHRGHEQGTSLAAIDANPTELPQLKSRAIARESAPPPPDLAAQYPVPDVDGMPLDEMYPSLLDWTHPVTGTELKLPEQSTAMFGAVRWGVSRSECRSGHCGVDLGGPIGRQVVAVGDGVVVRVERSEEGRDGRSGRYVRIEHDDGTLTSYMHLDAIAEGLQVGDRVDGGQEIGTLGATAIHHSSPHVHFGLEVPNVPGTHGDNTNTHYVDPAPFLVRATVLSRVERHHAIKPAI